MSSYDPNALSVKDILMQVVLPRVEGIDSKVSHAIEMMNDRIKEQEDRMNVFDGWRDKVMGAIGVGSIIIFPSLMTLALLYFA
jgi:hypothetical protein